MATFNLWKFHIISTKQFWAKAICDLLVSHNVISF